MRTAVGIPSGLRLNLEGSFTQICGHVRGLYQHWIVEHRCVELKRVLSYHPSLPPHLALYLAGADLTLPPTIQHRHTPSPPHLPLFTTAIPIYTPPPTIHHRHTHLHPNSHSSARPIFLQNPHQCFYIAHFGKTFRTLPLGELYMPLHTIDIYILEIIQRRTSKLIPGLSYIG